jgi:vancomycin permeability regulator SanA
MKVRFALAAIAVMLATPALAQEFYVVQDTTTKKCTVVQQKPTTTTMVVVGDGKVFKTQTEAEGALKTITVCK